MSGLRKSRFVIFCLEVVDSVLARKFLNCASNLRPDLFRLVVVVHDDDSAFVEEWPPPPHVGHDTIVIVGAVNVDHVDSDTELAQEHRGVGRV